MSNVTCSAGKKDKFIEIDENNCEIIDTITFRVHLESFLGAITHKKISKKLNKLFSYRKQVLINDLDFYKNHPKDRLHILMSGASGLIGSALKNFLTLLGHHVTPITRHLQANQNGVFWDIENQKIDLEQVEGYDAVIHLAGENIGNIWSEEKKEKIYKSRIFSTRLLVNALQTLKSPPKTFICASGCNAYQQGVDNDENGAAGDGFLNEVIHDWEHEACKYKKGRVALMRNGVVLTPKGGMLKKVLPAFKVCLGSILGDGQQHLCWIGIDDLVYQYTHVLLDQSLSGPINLTSPLPTTNMEFSKILSKILKRPLFLSLPKSILTKIGGKFAEETILSDLIARPKKLQACSKFYYPHLEQTLRHILGNS